MKKKIAVIFLASILALSAAACNSASSGAESKVESAAGGSTSSATSVTESGTESKTESKSESETESKADELESSKASSLNTDAKNLIQSGYIDIVKDGKYYMNMSVDMSSMTTSTSSDTPSNVTMVIATDTANQKLYVDLGYSLMGFQKIIVADGKQWLLDDTNKVAYYTDTTDDVQESLDSMTSSMLGSTEDIENNMKYVSDSVESFNGKDCYAVVYEVENEVSLGEGVSISSSSGLNTEQTYYFDKTTKELSGIKTNAMGIETTVVINEFTAEIPADLFTIPSDYTKTDMSAMMSGIADE